MPKPSIIKGLRRRPLHRAAGAAVVFLGLLIIVSWHAHWRSILQMVPDSAPMQYNTALCFILSGAGLFLLTPARINVARWLGAATGLFTLLTLLEYLTGRNFGIDVLFLKPYFEVATTYEGRMSPLSAICFIFVGSGIVLAGAKGMGPHRLTGTGLLACIVAVIAGVALGGYAFGIEAAYGWGAYSRMAVNTALIFLVLGAGLLFWAWQTAQAENFNFFRWLPVTGSLTLMIMVAFVSATNMAELEAATFWRQHTTQVLLSAQAFEDNLVDLQRGAGGYLGSGDPNALALYQASARLEARQFNHLSGLTSDNPGQQQRLKDLAAAMENVFSRHQRLMAVVRERGFGTAAKADTNSVERTALKKARVIAKAFSEEEERLLHKRDALEQADARNAQRLLIFGCVLAAMLLVVANVMASRELLQRRRAEEKLRELTTLQNAILHSANYAIIALDAKGVVRTFNSTAERMLGYSAEEVIGQATPMLWRDPGEVAGLAEKLSRELGRPIKPGIDILLVNTGRGEANESEVTFIRKDGSRFPAMVSRTSLADATGAITGVLGVAADITERKKQEAEREKLIAELRVALTEVRTLSGLIPICAWCKSIRSDQGFWQSVEHYVRDHTDATFSHGMCPTCAEKYTAEMLGGLPSKT